MHLLVLLARDVLGAAVLSLYPSDGHSQTDEDYYSKEYHEYQRVNYKRGGV